MINFIVSLFFLFTHYISSVQCLSITPTSMSICSEHCLPLNACAPVRRDIFPCFCQPCKCLVVGPTPEDLAPTSHCTGSLSSVQAISTLTSCNFLASEVFPLPFAYLATHLVNRTLCFLLTLQIPASTMLVFSFFLIYSILCFLPSNLG